MGSMDQNSISQRSCDALTDLDERVRAAPIGDSEENVENYAAFIEESNRLVKTAKSTEEVLKDCQLVCSLTKSIHESAKSINAADTCFNPDIFAQGILTRVRKEGAQEDWSGVACKTAEIFRYAPGLTYIVGSNFRADVNGTIEIKTRQKREKQARRALEARKEPEKVVNIQKTDEGVAAVTKTYNILMKEYKRAEETPICFFKFVVNPDSFSKTIESIFHLSFLVRDGRVIMALDGDKLPVVTPIPEGASKSGNSGQEQAKRVQALVSLSKAEWAEIIKEFQITRSMLP